MLMLLIGGRVTPSFTDNWLAKAGVGERPVPFGRADGAVHRGIGPVARRVGRRAGEPRDRRAPARRGLGQSLAAIALARACRATGCAGPGAARGLSLRGAGVSSAGRPRSSGPGRMPYAVGVHVWAVGGVGVMTLAMMTRATLGHSGRALDRVAGNALRVCLSRRRAHSRAAMAIARASISARCISRQSLGCRVRGVSHCLRANARPAEPPDETLTEMAACDLGSGLSRAAIGRPSRLTTVKDYRLRSAYEVGVRSAWNGWRRQEWETVGFSTAADARGGAARRRGLRRVARREPRRPDRRRGEGGADRRAERAAADHARPCDQGRSSHLEVQRARGPARRRRALHVLDFRRPRARQVHPHPRGRRGRVPSRQSPRQQESAQHRPSRGQRPGRRRGGVADRAGPQLGLLVQGAQSGALRLSLRDRAGGDARRQRHVRADLCRAEGGPAQGRSRILPDAGRLLHAGRERRAGPAAVQHGRRRSTRSRNTSCSTARSDRRSATRR